MNEYDAAPETELPETPEYDRDSKPWLELIKDAEHCFAKYQEKADKIDKLYASLESLTKDTTDREFQIFWANLEVLKPSIYARAPVPVVVTRFRNRKELARKAADVLERTLSTSLELDEFDLTMKSVRDDLATNARGALWIRYEASQAGEGALDERVAFDHVDRKDFLHDPARKWKEVEWVARRVYVTRKKGIERFGDVFIKAEFSEKGGKQDEYKGEKKAQVWEIWHKTQNLVVWVTPNIDEVLDIQPPFLLLDRFFPCPRPAYGTMERGSLKPVPDFLYYKDQVEEINELTARISALAEGLRLKGFYAGGAEDLASAIETAMKSTDQNAMLIPVANFAALGGQAIKDSIVWLPLEEVANTITGLIALRRQMIEDVYQITGISDIMRGSTDANETLGAQQLKSQYGSVRVRESQEELVRVARDAIAIAGEIISENFQPETLKAMSQVDDLPTAQEIQQKAVQAQQAMQQMQMQAQQMASSPQAQAMAQQEPDKAKQLVEQAQQAIQAKQGELQSLQKTVTLDAVVQLLREQSIRPFVLDIETDSTIQPDENAAKQRATEFITAVGGFIGQALPLVQEMPEAAPLATSMLQYLASQYRAGRELDGVLDDFTDKMKEAASQPKGPSPEEMKAQADAQAQQQKMQMDMAKLQNEQQGKQSEMQMTMAQMQQEHQLQMQQAQADLAKTAAEIQKIYADIQRTRAQTEAAESKAETMGAEESNAQEGNFQESSAQEGFSG